MRDNNDRSCICLFMVFAYLRFISSLGKVHIQEQPWYVLNGRTIRFNNGFSLEAIECTWYYQMEGACIRLKGIL